MRLVLDTSVLVAAFRSRNGASRALIDLFDRGRFQILLSTALLLEYEAVLLRTEHADIHKFSTAEVAEILNTLAGRSIHVGLYYDWRPQLRDPGDELVLALAINGNADAIITHNTADFLPEALSFGIAVLTPRRIIMERFRV